MRKSVNTIKDKAVPFIKGIKNLDVFIEDGSDNWNFHDSEIRSIRWNDKRCSLDVTIEPIGYGALIPGDGPDKQALIDFHFKSVVSVELNWYDYGYIFELDITVENGFLTCYFDSYNMVVKAERLSIGKPRFEMAAE